MIIERFCRTDFSSYEDFCANLRINVPENFNFAFDVFDEIAKKTPNKTALVWCNDCGEEKSFTFGELSELSRKAANMYAAHGLKKGDIAMTVLRSRYEYWIAALAMHRLGVVLVPATYQLTEKDFVYRFEAADVRGIITVSDPGIVAHIDAAEAKTGRKLVKFSAGGQTPPGYFDFDREAEKYSSDFARLPNQNSDPFLLYFTSGTTGMPKMVLHDYSYPLGHILTARFWQNLLPTDLHFTQADTGWAKTSWGKFYGQWLCEAAIFVYDYVGRFEPTDLLRVVEKHRVTVFCAPPTVFRFLIKADITKYDLSSLRHCCIAGEPLNPEVYNKWKQLTGLELKEGFGQTETAVLLATFPWLKVKPGSTGRPSPHFNAKLIGDDGQEVEPGDEGEICIPISGGRPAGITCGYYKDEEKTAEIMRGGYYHTGDIAWMDEDGYFWFVGRRDDVIKSSGYRIGPFEVESALLEHPAVLEAAITAVPDPERGQIVKATVVLTKGHPPSEALKKELQDHVKRTTAPYKYPRIIEFVDEIPKTLSGKIRRGEIRSKDAGK